MGELARLISTLLEGHTGHFSGWNKTPYLGNLGQDDARSL